MIRAVIDTNILFEGLSNRGPCGKVLDAWVARRFVPCVSTALALEYEEVLANKFSALRRESVLAALQARLTRAEYVPIISRVRPMSPDPDDDFVIECAYNAGALLVTHNTREFERVAGLRVDTASTIKRYLNADHELVAETALGIPVLRASVLLDRLTE